jgi:hypothetical protein
MTRRSLMKLGSTTTDKHCGNCSLYGDIAIERVTCHCGSYMGEGGDSCRHAGCRELGRDFETKPGCRVHGPLHVEIELLDGPQGRRAQRAPRADRHVDCVAGEGDFVNVVRVVESGEPKSIPELYPEYLAFLWEKWHRDGNTAPENASELFELQRSTKVPPGLDQWLKGTSKRVAARDVQISIGDQTFSASDLGIMPDAFGVDGQVARHRSSETTVTTLCTMKVKMMSGPKRSCRLVRGHAGDCEPLFQTNGDCNIVARCLFVKGHHGECKVGYPGASPCRKVGLHSGCVRRDDHEGDCRTRDGLVLQWTVSK